MRELAAPGAQTATLVTPPPKPRRPGRLTASLAPRPKRPKLGAEAYRLQPAELLVVPGPMVVAIQRAGTWPSLPRRSRPARPRREPYTPAGWDEDLAEQALSRMRRGTASLR